MDDKLRKRIEEFILDYENHAQEGVAMLVTYGITLDNAINLLTEVVNTDMVNYEP